VIKGVALGKMGPYSPTREDMRDLQTRGCKMIRIEADPHMGPGTLWYLHKRADMKLCLLLNKSLLPDLTNDDWNAVGDGDTVVDRRWRDVVSSVVRDVSGGEIIDYIEIWNEPNGNRDKDGTGLSPKSYAALHRIAATVVRTSSPKTRIISGGLFAHRDSAVGYMHDAVRAANDVKHPLDRDLTGWHPYLDSGGNLQVAHAKKYVEELYAAFRKPILITEFGWDTGTVSVRMQSDNIAAMYQVAKVSGVVEACLLFTLDDAPESNPPLHYGIRGKATWETFGHV